MGDLWFLDGGFMVLNEGFELEVEGDGQARQASLVM